MYVFIDQWVVVANKIFLESNPNHVTQVIENLNSIIIKKVIIDDQDKNLQKSWVISFTSYDSLIYPSINASLFLELCVIEYLKLSKDIDSTKKITVSRSPSRTNQIVSKSPQKRNVNDEKLLNPTKFAIQNKTIDVKSSSSQSGLLNKRSSTPGFLLLYMSFFVLIMFFSLSNEQKCKKFGY